MSNTNFQIALRFARMTGADLARLVDATPSYISQLASGHRSLGKNNVSVFASYLDVSPSWLLNAQESMPLYDPIEKVVFTCGIIRSEEIPGYGMLYHVYLDETGDIVPVILSSGIQFTPQDWQSGYYPRSAEEIPDIGWMDNTGTNAIMVDDLPRSLI